MSLKDDGEKKLAVTFEPPIVKRPKNLKALADEFKIDNRLSFVERAASFFDYLAKHAPYQLCAPGLAMKVTYGLAKMPRGEEDVQRFKDRSSAIRGALGRLYGRGLVVEKGLGMRATVDDEDLATTQQVREVERIRGSVNAAKRTHALIDVNKVRDPGVRRWLKGGVSPLLKQLTEDDRIFQLLPAKKLDEG